MISRQRQGFTLIELVLVIAVIGIIGTVITFTLETSLQTYQIVSDGAILQKFLDEALQQISVGDYKHYGIKDSLEFIRAGKESLAFVPAWKDDSHVVKKSKKKAKKKFVLNRPLKAGSAEPIGQILLKKRKEAVWETVPLIFQLRNKGGKGERHDFVILKDVFPLGTRVRFFYHPDMTFAPDTAMIIEQQAKKMIKLYQGEETSIPRIPIAEVDIKDLTFQYFDNSNSEILPSEKTGLIPKEILLNITAIKVNLEIARGDRIKKGWAFVNIRNTRTSGAGLIIQQGTKIKIPNSRDIRTFGIARIMGVREGDQIILEARSEGKKSWRIELGLGLKDGSPLIKQYSIYYPSGQEVYSEPINLTTDIPLDFLQLGSDGRYDYDFDEGGNNVVDLKGEVELKVVRLDPAGAALFVRP